MIFATSALLKAIFSTAVIFVGSLFSPVLGEASQTLKIVENEKVCMVTDTHFSKKQIPVSYNGKIYYCCCENCKETLSKDAKARIAKDSVSGRTVDKAKAVIGASDDNSVLYFESKKNFEEYKAAMDSINSRSKSNGGHSHH